MPMDSEPIQIHVVDKKAWIWDIEDFQRLRERHHIVGTMSGTLPQIPQQNLFLGLPVQLMQEEAAVLVSRGEAVFIDETSAFRRPSTTEVDEYWQARAIESKRQYALDVEKLQQRSEILKRQNLAQRSKAKFASEASTPPTSTKEDNIFSAPDEAQPEQTNIPANAPSSYNIFVPTSAKTSSHYTPKSATYTTLDAAKDSGIWTFPTTQIEQDRFNVFADLRNQGYYMTAGIKFGGDWMVYPGDPLRYHSHFVASIISSENESSSISLMDLVGSGRLGTTVKKSHMLCEWDNVDGKPQYYCIEWAGFG